MRNALVGVYLIIALISASCFYFFGDTRHKTMMYNVGRGLVWPISAFASSPEIDSDSEQEFAESFQRVLLKANDVGLVQDVQTSVTALQFYLYAKGNPSITSNEFKAVFNGESIEGVSAYAVNQAAAAAVLTTPSLRAEYMERLDGMDVVDVAKLGRDVFPEIEELLKPRVVPQPEVPAVAMETETAPAIEAADDAAGLAADSASVTQQAAVDAANATENETSAPAPDANAAVTN